MRAIWIKDPLVSETYYFKTEEEEPDIIYKGYGPTYTIQFDLFLREWDVIGSSWTGWIWLAHGFSGCELRSDVTWSSMGPCTPGPHDDDWARYEFSSAAAYTITGRHHGFDCTGNDITGGDVTVVVYVVKVDVDIDGISDENEESVGGLVVRNFDSNNAPRKKITIQKAIPTSWSGDVILTRADTKIKVFTATTGGTELTFNGTDNKFANSSLPVDLYVEGNTHSSTMRDTGLDVKGQVSGEDIVNCVDSVDFTVLEVGTPTMKVGSGDTVSGQNAKKDVYKGFTVASTYNLGPQKFHFGAFYWMGWGCEVSASVYPADFDYPNSGLKLDRDSAGRTWDATGQNSYNPKDFSATIPPGNDPTAASDRDDDPSPNGVIYDADGPGPECANAPQNYILRLRANFKYFATIDIGETHVRCSPILSLFTRFSMKQMDDPNGTNWIIVDPPDIQNDLQAGNGTTNMTWNLQ